MSSKKIALKADKKTIRNIICNYVQNEKTLVNQLYFKVSHGTTIGGFREDIWKGMFEQIIPKKFVIEQSVFIIDSEGRVSNEVDLAIFDETYTPYVFRYGKIKFIPIEAVVVAIECKSTTLDQGKLKKWTESIVALKTSCKSYARTINSIISCEDNNLSRTQTATRPLRILCCLSRKAISETLNNNNLFDVIIRAPSIDQGLDIEIDKSKENLQHWYHALNHAEKQKNRTIYNGCNIKDIKVENYEVNWLESCTDCVETTDAQPKRVSLLTFNLQLNQLLMLINNPMPFPHIEYAEMFNTIGREKDD